jgi:hypothetical protein
MPTSKKDFFEYFKENMEGVPFVVTPRSLFESEGRAVGALTALAVAVREYGSKVTIRELVEVGAFRTAIPYIGVASAASVAGGFLELSLQAGGVYAAYYLGACLGSLAVATGEWAADKTPGLSNGSYPLHVADNVCSRHGILFDNCLMDSENRPFRGKKPGRGGS